MEPAQLIGRDGERRALEDLLAGGTAGPRVLVIVGPQGSGRTSIAALGCDLAEGVGRRALMVSGAPGEEGIALAGLSQLLLPFIPQIESLPGAHRLALERPLGLASRNEPIDLVATGMAVIALMTQREEAAPLFVAVDDADRIDTETLSVLAFVAKRIDRHRAVLLLTAEPHGIPAQFERSAVTLRVGRLSEAESHALLEARAPGLTGSIRQQIVEQSAGSPLALLETAAGIPLPHPAHRPLSEPLRVGSVLEERVMARVRRLPEKTRARLVDAAVAESFGWTATRSTPMPGNAALGPAEEDGIVRISPSGVTFTHPAYWIALYHSTPYNERLQAHRRVAESLTDRPEQHAWHLGRATETPDERVASLLEASAATIGLDLSRVARALMLERAAELSENGDQRAHRFLAAAATAAPTGELQWVDELTARAMACVRDPSVRVQLIALSAWAAAARGEFSTALANLSRAAVETVETAPEAAWEVLSIAAAYGYQSGNRAMQAQMTGVVGRLASRQTLETPQQQARRIWVESYLKPGLGTAGRLSHLTLLKSHGPTDEPSLSRLAGAAWLDDETETAFDLADAAYGRLVAQGSYAAAAVIGPIRSWTAWDTGRWEDALGFATHTSVMAEAAGGGMLQSTGDAVAALVHAVRGESDHVIESVNSALSLIEGEECRSIDARVAQALGLNDLASGNFADAYGHFSRLFREDGAPLHWHISYFGIADMAAAALRADESESGRVLLARILDRFPAEPATRLKHLVLRAKALLADTDGDAETFFSEARNDPAGARWPFERAQLLLDYGTWLRRQRRVHDAKPLLARAQNIFDTLGAPSWAARATSELRASHVDVRMRTGSLDQLTAQQREIVLLAAQGLTNREIAIKMYLSPRTVASHLYRSFPKLGIRDRWQLRDMVDQHRRPDDDALEIPSVT